MPQPYVVHAASDRILIFIDFYTSYNSVRASALSVRSRWSGLAALPLGFLAGTAVACVSRCQFRRGGINKPLFFLALITEIRILAMPLVLSGHGHIRSA